MYLKEKVITILKIKNIILSIIAVILIFTSIANIAISSSSNWGNMETVWDAYSAPESEVCLIIGLVLVLIIWISRTQINNAVYYSG